MKKNTELSETFAIHSQDLEMLTGQALSNGGSYCDLYFEDTSTWGYSLRDSQISSCAFKKDYGCGIRVLDGDKTGYAYSESTDIPSLVKAAKAASAIAGGVTKIYKPVSVTTPVAKNNLYPMEKPLTGTNSVLYINLLRDLDKKIRNSDERVTNVQASVTYQLSKIMMYNSLGELTSDIRPLCSIRVTTVFSQGGVLQYKNASKSLRMGEEFYSQSLIDEMCSKIVSGVDQLFEAKRPKGGQMKVVMGAGASGILLHEAIGHTFEADFNRKGQSIFADKMGQQICRTGINIVDDATLPYYRGSGNYDDEGIPGQKVYMITDGRLTSYLHDRISADYYGVAPTGNGRRESFRDVPIPRMHSTYMESGTDGTLEDLIQRAGNGIYVDSFANGEVKIGEGDFTFYVKSGFLIENGKLTTPIKDVNIIGNGPQALANIEAVAGDLKVDQGTWTCGKGQDAVVSCGIPSVLIGSLTVGGQ